jgi:hypothetical protein
MSLEDQIRDLHHMRPAIFTEERVCDSCDPNMVGYEVWWPCPTALLVYSEAELIAAYEAHTEAVAQMKQAILGGEFDEWLKRQDTT